MVIYKQVKRERKQSMEERRMAKKYWEKVKADRYFCIEDINCIVIVEFVTRKNMLEYIDEYVENMQYGYYDEDTSYTILYKDGSCDYINCDYDGHKIRKLNIKSITRDNPSTSMVFGNFEINDCGVVTPSETEIIAEENIIEVETEYFDLYA